MKDAAKRKLIRFLNGYDRLMSKGSRNQGWNPTNVMYDERKQKKIISDELDELTGKDLNHELWRQLIYTLPVVLYLLFFIGLGIFMLLFF